ncbi:MAG: hypothetical protein M0021_14645 [Clostridia bacterium]|nr:hypothetical protein [Clostridia bacterium]
MILKSITGFLDQFDLPWLLLAIATILIIIFTNSRKDFWRCFPVGIWTMVTGTLLEQFFINNKFWVEDYIMIKVGELAYDPQKWTALHSLGIYFLSLMSALGFYCIYNNHSQRHSYW